MRERLRVGIIGAGRVGVDWHLPDIRAAGGDVVALADAVPGRAAKYAAMNEVGRSFDNWRELIAMVEVDVVAICTPPDTHEQIATESLHAGKHVYLEKPPALNAAQMGRIRDAARASGRRLMTGSNSVYYDELQLLRRWICEGVLGRVYYIEALRSTRHSRKQGWHRCKSVAGGGVVMDSSAHRIDVALFLLGDPDVRAVTARTYDHHINAPRMNLAAGGYMLRDVEEGLAVEMEKADIEDALIAMVQLTDGSTLILRDMAGAPLPDEMMLRVVGSTAGASAPGLLLHRAAVDEKAAVAPWPTKGRHVAAYEHLFACIRQGRETISNGDRAVTVMRIVDAIYQSAEAGGREVRCDEGTR